MGPLAEKLIPFPVQESRMTLRFLTCLYRPRFGLKKSPECPLPIRLRNDR